MYEVFNTILYSSPMFNKELPLEIKTRETERKIRYVRENMFYVSKDIGTVKN